MNLIKKTVILTDADAEGYVSIIRVGNDVGAKIVGGNFKNGMYAGLKIGSGAPIFAVLTGEKTEITLTDVSFQQNDSIGCVITDGEKLVARGGTGIRLKEVVDNFKPAEVTLITEPLVAPDGEETESNETAETISNETVSTGTEPTETTVAAEITDDEIEKRAFLERLSGGGGDFYMGIRDKLDELFVINPAEKQLTALIPNSDWIKINYDEEDYYVVGKLRENNKTILIGYGVPGKKTATPPKIADEIASYLSVDGISPYDGYWLIFQNADTGKIVPVQ